MPSKLKNYIKIIFIYVAILFLGIGCIDIIFLHHKLPVRRVYRYIRDLDIVIHRPNLNEVWEYEVYIQPFEQREKKSYRVITDRDGSRIGTETFSFQEEKKNLVIVGDSFTFGAHADYEKTIAGLLQKSCMDFNVLNFSVCGSNSYSYATTLSYYLQTKRYAPQKMIVGIYVDMQIGDIPRVLARKKFGNYKAFQGYFMTPTLYNKLQQSRIQRVIFFTELFLRRNSSLINIAFPKTKVSPEFAISLRDTLNEQDFPSFEKIIMSNVHDIQQIANLVPEQIIILFIPSSIELYNNYIKNKRTGAFDNNFYRLSRIFWDNIKMKLQQEDFQVVDPRNAIEKLFLDQGIYPYTVDGHLNENGFQHIFGLLLEKI